MDSNGTATRLTVLAAIFGATSIRPAMSSLEFLRYEVEVQRSENEVQKEQNDECDDDGLLDRVAHTLWTTLHEETFVASDGACDVPEHHGFYQCHPQIPELR